MKTHVLQVARTQTAQRKTFVVIPFVQIHVQMAVKVQIAQIKRIVMTSVKKILVLMHVKKPTSTMLSCVVQKYVNSTNAQKHAKTLNVSVKMAVVIKNAQIIVVKNAKTLIVQPREIALILVMKIHAL